jgi:glycosyltransferase involved in cell wall biosynthesis
MTPFFSIITPSILRMSLGTCIASVDAQGFDSYVQIVMVDDKSGVNVQPSARFQMRFTGQRHNDFGNAARHEAWKYAQGRYTYYLDDDNRLADPLALERIHSALASAYFPSVALFPILLEGRRFFPPFPPASGEVDTANLVVKTGIGQWPIGSDYDMDGKFISRLVQENPCDCMYFPDVEPIAIVEKANHGK